MKKVLALDDGGKDSIPPAAIKKKCTWENQIVNKTFLRQVVVEVRGVVVLVVVEVVILVVLQLEVSMMAVVALLHAY
jgi:hypothetical protein